MMHIIAQIIIFMAIVFGMVAGVMFSFRVRESVLFARNDDPPLDNTESFIDGVVDIAMIFLFGVSGGLIGLLAGLLVGQFMMLAGLSTCAEVLAVGGLLVAATVIHRRRFLVG